MSKDLRGWEAESPENKVSILQTEADEVLAFAVRSKFLKVNMFSRRRKKMWLKNTEPPTSQFPQQVL